MSIGGDCRSSGKRAGWESGPSAIGGRSLNLTLRWKRLAEQVETAGRSSAGLCAGDDCRVAVAVDDAAIDIRLTSGHRLRIRSEGFGFAGRGPRFAGGPAMLSLPFHARALWRRSQLIHARVSTLYALVLAIFSARPAVAASPVRFPQPPRLAQDSLVGSRRAGHLAALSRRRDVSIPCRGDAARLEMTSTTCSLVLQGIDLAAKYAFQWLSAASSHDQSTKQIL